MHKTVETIMAQKGIVRVAFYSRFSSDMQREESIEAQEYDMEQFAEQNGLLIVARYQDRAKSGTKSDREEFQRMLKDAARDKFDLVLVHKLDRLARKASDSYGARVEFAKYKIGFIAVTQPFDTEPPEGRLMTAIFEALAEFYSENLATEIQKGKKTNARKGMHVGGKPPLGYDVDKETLQLVINEREAEGVRLAFELANKGVGYEKISMELERLGIRSKYGNPFGKNSLHGLLRNAKYTGLYVYNISAAKDENGKRNGHQSKEDADIIKLENGCPAIIDKDLFDAVQQKMTVRKRAESGGRASAQETYLLSGKIVCGECESHYQAMLRKPSKGHPNKLVNYRCSRKNAGIKCSNREISRDKLEAAVLDRLSQVVFDDKIIPNMVAGYHEYHSAQNSTYTNRLHSYKDDLKRVNRQIENLLDAIAEGRDGTGSQALAGRLKKMETDKAGLEHKMALLQEEMNATTITEEAIAATFTYAKELFNKKDMHNMQEIVNRFVDKVTIYADRVEVSYNFGFKTDIFKNVMTDFLREREAGEPPKKDYPHAAHELRVDTCGGEGGTRTLAKSKNRMKSWIMAYRRNGFVIRNIDNMGKYRNTEYNPVKGTNKGKYPLENAIIFCHFVNYMIGLNSNYIRH